MYTVQRLRLIASSQSMGTMTIILVLRHLRVGLSDLANRFSVASILQPGFSVKRKGNRNVISEILNDFVPCK